MNKLGQFVRHEPVLAAAGTLAVFSMLLVPPDRGYRGYIDRQTLLCLFSLMAALKGIEREGVLRAISARLVSGAGGYRALVFLLVFLCFFSSMLMTNDVALIAFVPITIGALRLCGKERGLALVVVLQTLAANIGSGLTPIGNPQNLYLFMRYGFSLPEFFARTAPFTLLGGILLALTCLFLPNPPLPQEDMPVPSIRRGAVLLYGILFLLAVTAVFGLIPGWIAAALIIAAIVPLDRRTLAELDYSLLLTFVAIFVLVGNLARIDAVYALLSGWAERDTLLTAVLSSQVISNVPAAVMLSGFTDNARDLLVGVNVGGMGTLIASMASVISYKLYAAADPKGSLRYLGIFTGLNLAFLLLILLPLRTLFS